LIIPRKASAKLRSCDCCYIEPEKYVMLYTLSPEEARTKFWNGVVACWCWINYLKRGTSYATYIFHLSHRGRVRN